MTLMSMFAWNPYCINLQFSDFPQIYQSIILICKVGRGYKSAKMADFISEDKIQQFKTAFSAFDQNNCGMIKSKLLGNVLR